MKLWFTRDSDGIIQLWKNKPVRVNVDNHIFFEDKEREVKGIVVNSLFTDDTDKEVCCIERVLM